MPIYTCYPYTADGAALMFEALELADDEAARRHAGRLLALHASAAEVVVWEGDRLTHREMRAPPVRLDEATPGAGQLQPEA